MGFLNRTDIIISNFSFIFDILRKKEGRKDGVRTVCLFFSFFFGWFIVLVPVGWVSEEVFISYEKNSLGNSGLKVSKVILGAMSYGNPKV